MVRVTAAAMTRLDLGSSEQAVATLRELEAKPAAKLRELAAWVTVEVRT